ncbi:cobalamin biosynthesis protein [Pseudonocardia sp. H11422]|uniref:cobalamin biosynthesis protein n=1 Tax=Pseudonocardia sp. H11422 TaxID=2835866 RepID=UPI0027E3A8B2|nr:cobalamin biosynthesis protein [Pseudonocardia sp. H11422]
MTLVVGIGSVRGVSAAAVTALLDRLYREHDLDPHAVRDYASVDHRAGEPGILAAIAPAALRTYPSAMLDVVAVPNPSARVREAAGTRSVAEAAALLAAAEMAGPDGARAVLVAGKMIGDGVTAAAARIVPAPR